MFALPRPELLRRVPGTRRIRNPLTRLNGCVDEVGDHFALLRRNGIYSQLHELRFALQPEDR
jgi:hypothetical protein